ncbi:arginase family protein [Paenibacillus sp. FSL R5-0766]|uniref:arginase family protein n=1 Tax=unclassified Paenibacillus TaxID=185978 RepID=UPI00096DCED1|nr:arginase family protein [Paenibacillus sp. FSL R5-0765]OMF61327.1 arginase [Paenibacillus sp. FSL R5-0765]
MSAHTIRLLMPQWQGGDNPNYSFGAELLAWLAPQNDQPLIKVPVYEPDEMGLEVENGIRGRAHVINQLKSAQQIIAAYQPESIIMFGGDCLVEQAPFAYLNERYNGELGVLWIDAHPDISTPKEFANSHTMVLGNLLGEGDTEFAGEVKVPLKPGNIFIAGLEETFAHETEMIQRLGIKTASTKELQDKPQAITEWIVDQGIKHLAIHLDLDVLDPSIFRSLLFANPDLKEPIDFPMGKMHFPQLNNLIQTVSQETTVVGLGITEHMPWDSMNLKSLLNGISIFN